MARSRLIVQGSRPRCVPPPAPRISPARLNGPGWTHRVGVGLAALVDGGAGLGLPVTLDFDNTILCGDIGEATMAVLIRRGLLNPQRIPATLSPAFRNRVGKVVRITDPPDLSRYYEAYGSPTVHGAKDPAPPSNAYTWAVEIMEGLSVADIVSATAEAMQHSRIGEMSPVPITPGCTAYPAPYVYPEMLDLIARLLRQKFQVWVVSASNVWSVRHVVRECLNPSLRLAGAPEGIAAHRILGASTLLFNRRQELVKDAVLVRESEAYAHLELRCLAQYRLSSRLVVPAPVYAGKVGVIWQALGRAPYLAAGDSAGDHAMLTFSEHRLWIARLDQPELQQATARLIDQTDPSRWWIQPTWLGAIPGFIADRAALAERPDRHTTAARRAVRHLSRYLGF